MLTPVEMQGRELKQGRGYQKKEMDDFLSELFRDYETLYRENMELRDKVNVLTDGLKYYKDLEKTLQQTLLVAQKAAEETTKVSEKKADAILFEAQNRASEIVYEANHYYENVQNSLKSLMQQYESYRIQCKKLAATHIELLNSPTFQVNFEAWTNQPLPEFQPKSFPKAESIVNPEETKTKEIPKEIIKETKTKEVSAEKENKEDKERTISRMTEQEAVALDNELFEFFNLGDEE